MGHAGVTAHTHYDRSHNFFVQIYGTKRWILVPPSQWENIYLYPGTKKFLDKFLMKISVLHPHYHQSQIDWDDVNLKNFPNFSQTEAYEVYSNIKGSILIFLYPGYS
jgi:hypoxia-inducible factor 1-alpha inhibitor (HIF hydroxylase)